MSQNPEFTFSVHGRPTAAIAEIGTTGVSIRMDGQSSVTIFCGDAALACALADGINSAIERHRQHMLAQPDYSALVLFARDELAVAKHNIAETRRSFISEEGFLVHAGGLVVRRDRIQAALAAAGCDLRIEEAA